jgi:xanthine/uracil/vitamin C permease (AzgA family)
MLNQLKTIDWEDPLQAIPAFTTLTIIPFTFSVPNGVAFGVAVSSAFFFIERIYVKWCCCTKKSITETVGTV